MIFSGMLLVFTLGGALFLYQQRRCQSSKTPNPGFPSLPYATPTTSAPLSAPGTPVKPPQPQFHQPSPHFSIPHLRHLLGSPKLTLLSNCPPASLPLSTSLFCRQRSKPRGVYRALSLQLPPRGGGPHSSHPGGPPKARAAFLPLTSQAGGNG